MYKDHNFLFEFNINRPTSDLNTYLEDLQSIALPIMLVGHIIKYTPVLGSWYKIYLKYSPGPEAPENTYTPRIKYTRGVRSELVNNNVAV
jgi:hypothetical protein